jgi:hypothetical protein
MGSSCIFVGHQVEKWPAIVNQAALRRYRAGLSYRKAPWLATSQNHNGVMIILTATEQRRRSVWEGRNDE